MNYILHILVMLEIYILLALSANQKVGLSGLLSLAQAVFYGVACSAGKAHPRWGLTIRSTGRYTACRHLG